MQLPALNLKGIGGGFGTGGLGLNLSAIPAGKAKSETHFVYLCKFYKELNDDEIEELKANAEDTFGEGTKVIQLTKVPEQYVIQPPEKLANSIPTLPAIDAAYQDVSNIPFLIDECYVQQALLTKEIDQSALECDNLIAEKQKLLIENAVLEERIRNAEAELKRQEEWANGVKESFDNMMKNVA